MAVQQSKSKAWLSLLLFAPSAVLAQTNIYCASQSYKLVANPVWHATDAWCQATCNQPTTYQYCPSNVCMCAGPNEEPAEDKGVCELPRRCPFNKYTFNPGTTAANSDWCQQVCTHPPGPNGPDDRMCPCSLCLCDNPCGKDTLVTFNFDDVPRFSSLSSYNGFNFANMFPLNPDPPYPSSGYLNGRQSKPHVAFNGFGSKATFKMVSGGTFKFVTGAFTAAWQKNVGLTVTGKKAGQQVFQWKTMVSTEKTVFPENSSFPAPVFGDVDEVEIMTTAGTEDPAYPGGSGKHVAMDDIKVCVPAGTKLMTKRSTPEEDNANDNMATDGPMNLEKREAL